MLRSIILIFILLLITGEVRSLSTDKGSEQSRIVDSLKLALKKAKHDTTRCNILSKLAETASDEEWPKYNDQLLLFSEGKLKTILKSNSEYNFYKSHYASALNNLGSLTNMKGDIPKALDYYEKSLKLNEELGNKKAIASSKTNIGTLYYSQGDISKALNYFLESLKLQEQIRDKEGIANSYNNIASVYQDRGDIPKALIYFESALKLQNEIGDKEGKATSLDNIGHVYYDQGNIPKAFEYISGSLKIREELGIKKDIAASLNNIAFIYSSKGEIAKAIECHLKCLKMNEELGNKEDIADSYNSLGSLYKKQGNIPKALDYYSRSISIQEAIGNKTGLAISLNNIAIIYSQQGEISKSLECFNRSLKAEEEAGDKNGIASVLNNIGDIFLIQGDKSVITSKEESLRAGIFKALDYYNRSLKMLEETGNKQAIAISLNNIGNVYDSYGDPSITDSREESESSGIEKALTYYEKSLKIQEEIGDKTGLAVSLTDIGGIYLRQKNYNKALKFSSKSFDISKELGFPENIIVATQQLSQIYKAIGNYKLALVNYELFIQMRDSINNESNRKASIKSQLKYEYEKQAAADSVAHAKESEIKNAEIAKQTAEIKAKRNQQYVLFGGLALVMIFAGFMYNRFKVTQRQKVIIESQKEIVEEQKKIVEEKQKEILDSIHYARRIQNAHLPSEKFISNTITRINNKTND